MARQVDRIHVSFQIIRNDDGSYAKTLGNVSCVFSDPVAAKSVDKEKRSCDRVPDATYQGAATVDAFLDDVVKKAQAECGA